MAQAKSFIEVLEDEIRADLRRELEAELRNQTAPRADQVAATHAAGRFEAWLASNVGPVTFKPRRSYGARPTARPAPAVSAPTFHAQTSVEIFAVELLARHSGVTLESSFTADQLKSAWRKAALKTLLDLTAAKAA